MAAEDHPVEPAQVPAEEDLSEEEAEQRQARAPWHFKLIVVGSVIYLGYRFYQLIVLIIHHL
jgi:hypothetical protein